MKRQQQRARLGVLVAALFLSIGSISLLHAVGPPDVAELRRQLLGRYDIVRLQQGVALVPRRQNSSVRMIQVVDGIVSVDGETLTGRQLSDKLGGDANLIVQVSYLDRAAQRELALSSSSGQPAPAVTAPPTTESGDTISRKQVSYGDMVRFGGGVTVASNERVQGDVVAMFGPADIDGEVTRDVVVIMGPLNLGPTAVVRGNIAVVGGSLHRADGAIVSGKIDEIGFGNQRAHNGEVVAGRGRTRDRFGSLRRHGGSLAGTATRISLLLLLGLVAVALGRPGIEQIGERAAVSPVRAGLVGLLAEILFVPAVVALIVVLAVSIVGIPLLLLVPFGVAAVMLLMLVGFAGVAYHLGAWVARRVGFGEPGHYLSLTIGVITIAGLTLIARLAGLSGGPFIGVPIAAVGYLLEYLAWTIGFGALILTWFDRHHVSTPQPAMTPTAPGNA
jgi:hypothetical protein